MLRVAEQYAATDTGRQRRANEDSLLARAPLFVVADGMGGAQAGEVRCKGDGWTCGERKIPVRWLILAPYRCDDDDRVRGFDGRRG